MSPNERPKKINLWFVECSLFGILRSNCGVTFCAPTHPVGWVIPCTVYRDADYWMPDRANVNVRPFHDGGNRLNVRPTLDGGEDEDEEARYDAWMSGCGVLITNIIKLIHVLVLQLVYCVKLYKACYNKEETWIRSCSYMNGMLKNILLLRQGVESNPGPIMHKSNVSVRTYNLNNVVFGKLCCCC